MGVIARAEDKRAGANPPSQPERFFVQLDCFTLKAFQTGMRAQLGSAHGREGGLAPAPFFKIQKMNVQETLAELVAIDSVSSRSNREIVDYLAQRCEAMGLSVSRFPYTDVSGVEKINLIALAGTEFTEGPPKVELALVGHTDTVPYDPNWDDALRLTEREGKLYGRGSCDTKAFIAATLAAVEAVDLKHLAQPLALIFTADEEIGLLGAKRLAEAQLLRTRYAIVGEPTSLRPMRAGKGLLPRGNHDQRPRSPQRVSESGIVSSIRGGTPHCRH